MGPRRAGGPPLTATGSAAPDPKERYRARAEEAAAAAGALEGRSRRLGTARTAAGLGAFALVVLLDPLEGLAEAGAWVGLAAVAAVFFFLVRRHRRTREGIRRHRTLEGLAREGIARLERDWSALDRAGVPEGPPGLDGSSHPYAADLHLFGHASLYRLLGPPTTVQGARTLAGWLLHPAPPDALERRRGAVRHLAGREDFRVGLAALGRAREAAPAGAVDRFVAWAEAPGWLEGERWVRAAAWTLPPVTLALAATHALGLTGPLWLPTFLAQAWALRRVASRVGAEAATASGALAGVRSQAAQLALLDDLSTPDPLVRELQEKARDAGVPAPRALRTLARRLETADSRANMFWAVANFALLADVHLQRRLERWKAAHGRRVRGWLEALGEVEALAALATLAADHPAWAEPTVGPGPLRAEALGHPLLPDAACVRNDVHVPEPGGFLLVTGSNMSGKSTLLRAIGANAVLALAGGRTCARSFHTPPVRVRTSMLVGDSLEGGVSRFMAELLRLADVVEAARGEDGPPVLFLLDEVLQGTNSEDRRVAARVVLRHLLEAGAVGAVTTHDVTLHEAPDLRERASAFHFRETVEREDGRARLRFDYRLRPGLATTRNALELLDAVGLGRGEEPTRESPPEPPAG